MKRDVPYLSLGSIMASGNEADSEAVGRYGCMRLKAGLQTSAGVCGPPNRRSCETAKEVVQNHNCYGSAWTYMHTYRPV